MTGPAALPPHRPGLDPETRRRIPAIVVLQAGTGLALSLAAGALLTLAWTGAFPGAALVAGSAAGAAALGAIAVLLQALRVAAAGSASVREAGAPANPNPEGDERSRLELLGGLAAGLAHELGQPLSVARVGIEGVHYLRQLGREPTPEHLARTLSRVGMSLFTMTQTIEHLRSLAQPEATLAVPVDLGSVISGMLADRDQWLRFQDAHIEWTSPEGEAVWGLADVAGLRLILANLLRNAVEAVAGQGEERRLVRIILVSGPMVTVHDSGPGISPERLSRIFDPFFSAKAGPGRGIGLSLALASAQRMGGDLTLTSVVGSGTTFVLRLRPVPDGSQSRVGPAE